MQPRSVHPCSFALRLLAAGTAAWVCHGAAQAGDYDEALSGDLSGNRLSPSFWQLSDGPLGGNGFTGNNVLSGSTGRAVSTGAVDRDYLHFVVPQGLVLSALRVGSQTTSSGGQGAFIGLAAGPWMPLDPGATSAAGLLGWRHYSVADRNTDILDDMGKAGQGATGFSGALGAGDYSLWIQELASGSYSYRFNLQVSAVPEPASAWLLALGLGLAVAAAQRRR